MMGTVSVSLNERIIKTNNIKNFYLHIQTILDSGIKPIVFFDIDNTFCVYSLDKPIRLIHETYIYKILDLLEEENLYFVTSRSEYIKKDTIELLTSIYVHPFIHENMKIMYCKCNAGPLHMLYNDEIPKSKKVLELKEKFVPKTWVFFIDDLDKHVEDMYHALKFHKINFTCYLFDDRKASKPEYVDMNRGDKLVFDLSEEYKVK